MLCRGCRRQLEPSATACRRCGLSAASGHVAFDLVGEDGTHIAIDRDLVLGRARESDVPVLDPAVSRRHAFLSPGTNGPTIADAGSVLGTFVDGARVQGTMRVRDGAEIRVGGIRFVAERQRAEDEGGRTIVVPALSMPVERCPRLRSGATLKRLPESEAPRRWVVHAGGAGLRMGDDDAALVALLDGQTDLGVLVTGAEQRLGAHGPARLAALLVELSERGMLSGGAEAQVSGTRLRRLLAPRKLTVRSARMGLDALYSRGAWVLLSSPARICLLAVAIAGAIAFGVVVGRGTGTPFVVQDDLGLGALVFIGGRLAFASLHELAHGLALVSMGREVREAGIMTVFVFPYLFVDTTDAWLESRRRRLVITAAGPAADLVLAGGSAIAALALEASAGEIAFQLAAGGYLGALLNLNPMLERDGYHLLSDALGEPNLRRRALRWLATHQDATPAIRRYAAATVLWLASAAVASIVMSVRYAEPLQRAAPWPWLAWALLGAVWAAILAPFILLTRSMIRRPSRR